MILEYVFSECSVVFQPTTISDVVRRTV